MALLQKRSKILLSTSEEIRNRNAVDWLTSHISFMLPLHKHKGEMYTSESGLYLKFSVEKLHLRKEDIIDIHYGFDSVFTPGQDRSIGIAFKPLRLSTKRGQTYYIITDFNRLTRTTQNGEWFRLLTEWM